MKLMHVATVCHDKRKTKNEAMKRKQKQDDVINNVKLHVIPWIFAKNILAVF